MKEGLKARGEIIDDLPLKLFKGYISTSDSKFVEYTEKKEDGYMDGKDIDGDLLMQLALNKYTIRKQNNTWGAPRAEQEQLTALTSEITKLKEDKGLLEPNPPKISVSSDELLSTSKHGLGKRFHLQLGNQILKSLNPRPTIGAFLTKSGVSTPPLNVNSS